MGTNFKYAAGRGPNDLEFIGKVVSVGSGTALVRDEDGREVWDEILAQLQIANAYNSLAQDEELKVDDLQEDLQDA